MPANGFLRYLAFTLDQIIITCLLIFSGFMLYFFVSRFGSQQELYYGFIGFIRFNLLFFGAPAFFIVYIYYATFYTCFGSSPGKMFLGLRVVDFYSGENIGPLQVLFREFFGKWLSAGLMFFGFFLALLRRDGRSLHDFFASTHVIYDED